jgi:hypothetical protein
MPERRAEREENVMSLSIRFPDIPAVPAESPVLTVRPHLWNLDAATELARRMEIRTNAEEAGLWMVARDDRAALEVYYASSSYRYSRLDFDGEGREGVDSTPNKDEVLGVAERWIETFGPEQARAEVHSITAHEVLVAEREAKEPREVVVGMDVNYRFAFDGTPLLGPGAKAKVSVHHTLDVSGAYRFWRDVEAVGEARILPVEQLLERFSSSPLFADLTDDTARAQVDSVRFGWLCLPPTEPMSTLVPALELRGTISTEAQPRYEFVRFVAATDPDQTTAKRSGHVNTRPALLLA